MPAMYRRLMARLVVGQGPVGRLLMERAVLDKLLMPLRLLLVRLVAGFGATGVFEVV
jgi:hypothetical protein